MLRRLVVGLVLGLVVGGVVAAGLVAGLRVLTFAGTGGAFLAYLAAAVTGTLTGLVAGKPIWSSGAKVEAGLKALFGALIGAGVMFAMRRWAGAWMLELPQIGVDHPTPIGDLPVASLPLLAAVLGGFFGLDNTDSGPREGPSTAGSAKTRPRVANDGAEQPKARLGKTSKADPDDDVEVISKRANR